MIKIICEICKQDIADEHHANLCSHKKGFTHLGCCKNSCSWHGEPCDHSLVVFQTGGR
ncbi:MAG: hypothetical protein JXB14_00275 [Candidatus Altiarchaeota archaeon]|nr:hypothetical protein [Candidatus Altiarchaeota archaeon]